MKRSFRVAFTTVLLLATIPTGAAEKEKNNDPQRQAIEKVMSSFESAFNKGDAKAPAAFWTPDGDLIGLQGERTEGRKQIEKLFGGLFSANKDMKLKFSIDAVHLVGEDAAVVDATAEVFPPLPAMPAEPRSTMVLVRRDGRWLIETARDTLAYSHSNYRYLKTVQWMIGEWTDNPASPEKARLHSSCDWTAEKNFLIRKFNAEGNGRQTRAGTEVIGWDPRHHRIRSWNFDSNGGYGESTWRREGDHWIIHYSGVLQDGSEVSCVYLVSRIDNDTVTLKATERMVNDEKQPDLNEVTIHRLPPGEEKRPAAGEKPAPKTSLP